MVALFALILVSAVGLALMGGIIDRIGTRIGYAMSIGIWTVYLTPVTCCHQAMSFCWSASARSMS